MRFNTPPGWPEPPAGWKPEPGWTPDPSWPDPPPGWQLWVEDEAQPPTQGFGYATTPSTFPIDAPAPEEKGPPTKQFWLGIVLVLIGGGSLYLSSGPQGGLILTGLLLWGAVLVGKAIVGYFAGRREGLPALGSGALTLAIVAMVAAVGVVGLGATRTVESMALSETAGSCWQAEDETGTTLLLVRCGGAHDFVATSFESDPDNCPVNEAGWVELTKGGVLCLELAG